MIKVEVIEDFNLGRFNEITNIVRKNQGENGKLYVGDRFECSEELCNYLNGGNHLGRSFIKILEVIPEKPVEKVDEPVEKPVEKPVKKITTRRRKSIIE